MVGAGVLAVSTAADEDLITFLSTLLASTRTSVGALNGKSALAPVFVVSLIAAGRI
ncbi:hypothetical protein AAHS21_16665 [Mycobacterium sp. 050272]|uniref:hypothetical protein n=1 Tax=Mycobacterium sp. 050272 TaxID=3142488 RepID=UPI00319D5BC1